MKQLIKTVIREFLNEAYVDKDGNLKDFEYKTFYDFDKIKKFVDWFQSEYSDYTLKQGWAIFDSDSEIPNQKYHSDSDKKDKELETQLNYYRDIIGRHTNYGWWTYIRHFIIKN